MREESEGSGSRPWIWRGLIALVVLVVVAVVIFSGDDEEPARLGPDVSQIVEPDELREIAAEAESPIYWAGEIEGTEIEITFLEGAGALVTYLEADGEAGPEASATSTAIGTYPTLDPSGAVDSIAEEPGARVRESADGRTVVASRHSPTSVYFVGPDDLVQVEVYDPEPAEAMRLALSEEVRPVE